MSCAVAHMTAESGAHIRIVKFGHSPRAAGYNLTVIKFPSQNRIDRAKLVEQSYKMKRGFTHSCHFSGSPIEALVCLKRTAVSKR